MTDPADFGGDSGLSDLLGESLLRDLDDVIDDGDTEFDLAELLDADLLGDIDGLEVPEAGPGSYTDELIVQYGDLTAVSGAMPGDHALGFIDAVMHASPEQLDHIAGLEQSMTAHQAEMDLESPAELQASFAEQDRVANHEFLEWQRHEDALADAEDAAARAAALEDDVRRDLGIGP
jgi:hypothetical protein